MLKHTRLYPLSLLVIFFGLHLSLSGQPALDEETGWIHKSDVRPIIQITGNIDVTSDGKTAYLSYEDLKSFPQHSIMVKEPWFGEERIHSGPLMKEVLAFLKAEGSRLDVKALNDYKIKIPISDIENHSVILAIDLNGRPMPVRDMGPSFMTYPLSTHPNLQKEIYYARSVWQIESIRVEKLEP